MNERINELYEKAKLPLLDKEGNCKYGDTYFSKEKFAELIIRECANVADNSYDKGRCPVGGFVMQHFGVEE